MAQERRGGKQSTRSICCVHFQRAPCLQKGISCVHMFCFPWVWSSLMKWVWIPFSTTKWRFSKGTCDKVNVLKNHVLPRHIWKKEDAEKTPDHCGQIERPKGCIFSLLGTSVKQQRKPSQSSCIRMLTYTSNGNRQQIKDHEPPFSKEAPCSIPQSFSFPAYGMST